MGLFFASKVEKLLEKSKKKELKIQVRYIDSSHFYESKIVRVDPEKFLFLGFTDSLREDLLEIRIPELDSSFTAKVTHISKDIRGQIIFHSPHPETVQNCYKVEERHFVYPKVRAWLAWETGQGAAKLELFVWDISHTRVELVNASDISFLQDHSFAPVKVQAGRVECLMDLKVVSLEQKVHGRQILNILACAILTPDEHFEELIQVCTRIDDH